MRNTLIYANVWSAQLIITVRSGALQSATLFFKKGDRTIYTHIRVYVFRVVSSVRAATEKVLKCILTTCTTLTSKLPKKQTLIECSYSTR